MNTNEKARKLMAQEHLTDEERHEKMVNRAAESEQVHPETVINEKARELLAQERHHEATVDEKMLHRTKEEIE